MSMVDKQSPNLTFQFKTLNLFSFNSNTHTHTDEEAKRVTSQAQADAKWIMKNTKPCPNCKYVHQPTL